MAFDCSFCREQFSLKTEIMELCLHAEFSHKSSPMRVIGLKVICTYLPDNFAFQPVIHIQIPLDEKDKSRTTKISTK